MLLGKTPELDQALAEYVASSQQLREYLLELQSWWLKQDRASTQLDAASWRELGLMIMKYEAATPKKISPTSSYLAHLNTVRGLHEHAAGHGSEPNKHIHKKLDSVVPQTEESIMALTVLLSDLGTLEMILTTMTPELSGAKRVPKNREKTTFNLEDQEGMLAMLAAIARHSETVISILEHISNPPVKRRRFHFTPRRLRRKEKT